MYKWNEIRPARKKEVLQGSLSVSESGSACVSPNQNAHDTCDITTPAKVEQIVSEIVSWISVLLSWALMLVSAVQLLPDID